jgi:carbon storage regulator
MLLLTRRIGESIHIGDDIQVVVTNCNHSQVRLGIDAPRSVKIWRGNSRLDGNEKEPRSKYTYPTSRDDGF